MLACEPRSGEQPVLMEEEVCCRSQSSVLGHKECQQWDGVAEGGRLGDRAQYLAPGTCL